MNTQEKHEALENTLNNLGFNNGEEEYFIDIADARCGEKFAVGKKYEMGTIDIQSDFYTYDEMNAFFMGILKVTQDRFGFNWHGHDNGFVHGYLVACQYMVACGQDSLAQKAILETGIPKKEWLSAQEDQAYLNDKMIPLIKETFE